MVISSAAHAQAASQAPKSVSRADFTKNVDARFAAIDSNHDGVLTKDEIAAAQMKALEQAQAKEQSRLEAEFKKLDTNHDSQLSLAEFKAAVPQVKALASDQLLARLDANKDGKVSLAEYRAPQLGSFDRLDADHNATLTPQEIQATRRR
jgi:Ca2+-binding EF-hand superfamily protein